MAGKVCAAHSGLVQAVENLEQWQNAQNGALQALDKKLDRLTTRAFQFLVSTVLLLAGVIVDIIVRLSRG